MADTQDVSAAVQYLVKEGLVDSKKVAITGGSAGALLKMLVSGRPFLTLLVEPFGQADTLC